MPATTHRPALTTRRRVGEKKKKKTQLTVPCDLRASRSDRRCKATVPSAFTMYILPSSSYLSSSTTTHTSARVWSFFFLLSSFLCSIHRQNTRPRVSYFLSFSPSHERFVLFCFASPPPHWHGLSHPPTRLKRQRRPITFNRLPFPAGDGA